MGFDSVAANMIMFIAVVTIAGSFAVLMSVFAQQTSSSLRIQQNSLSDKLKTDVTITSTAFNNDTDPHTTSVYVKNTGKTKLILNDTDIYLDGFRFGHNERTVSIEQDTSVGNPLIWDPKEIVLVTLEQNLSGGIHTVRITTSNGVSDTDTFSN